MEALNLEAMHRNIFSLWRVPGDALGFGRCSGSVAPVAHCCGFAQGHREAESRRGQESRVGESGKAKMAVDQLRTTFVLRIFYDFPCIHILGFRWCGKL